MPLFCHSHGDVWGWYHFLAKHWWITLLVFMNHFFATIFCTGLNIISKSKNHHFRVLLLFVKETVLNLSHCLTYQTKFPLCCSWSYCHPSSSFPPPQRQACSPQSEEREHMFVSEAQVASLIIWIKAVHFNCWTFYWTAWIQGTLAHFYCSAMDLITSAQEQKRSELPWVGVQMFFC